MSRRLSLIKTCAVCNASFTPKSHHGQPTCSPSCGAIYRSRRNPHSASMIAANAQRKRDFLVKRKQELAGLSVVEAYILGKKDGYSVGYQRRRRQTREMGTRRSA